LQLLRNGLDIGTGYVIIEKNVCVHEKELISIPATIKELAVYCGVSEGTVDRALNNRIGIKDSTKQRILAAAKELGYRPNHLARCLATGSTKTIGIVCVDLRNNFFSSLIESIEMAAQESGYFISLTLTHNDPRKESDAIQYMAERHVDGLILFPISTGGAFVEKLQSLHIPIVTIYNRLSDDFVHVDVDCRQIMRSVVSYLVEKGYHRIIYVDPHFQEMKEDGINVFSIEQRRMGYLEGMREEMLGEGILVEKFDREEVLSLARNRGNEKTAFICRNDLPAVALLDMFRKGGVRVPQDVGIMGFDNIQILNSISPRIASVDCGIQTIGRKAVISLLRMMKGEQVEDCIVGYKIVDGESV